MKKHFTLYVCTIALCCISYQSYSQVPQYLNYQGVARNGSSIISNQPISLQFTIHDQTTNGTPVYEEKFVGSIQTNAYGIFATQIGSGTVEVGTLSSIDWSSGPKYLEVDIDEAGGSTFLPMGTTQLISVPYALYAQNVSPSGGGVPPGTVVAYFGATLPVGWLLCNGSAISRTTYANLYTAIGTNSGYGDQSTTFNLPDLRGYFLRGTDAGAGHDPDAGTRTAQNPGGNTGNNVGSFQADTLKSHRHYGPGVSGIASGPTFSGHGVPDLETDPAFWGSYTGGSETRPKNVYVNYIIKY